MTTETEMPEEVLVEIAANRKVTAIKLLRKQLGVDLKEAKEMVDAYMEANPPTSVPRAPETDTGIGRILVLIIGVGVIYGIYRLLS